jgi:hypothetical protein
MFQESDCQSVVNRPAIVAAPAVAEKLGFVRRHVRTMNSKVFVVIGAYLLVYADSFAVPMGRRLEMMAQIAEAVPAASPHVDLARHAGWLKSFCELLPV